MSLKSPYSESIYDLRVVVLVEQESFSNKYHQIALNKDQYRKLLDFLESTGVPDGDGFTIKIVDDVKVVLPDLVADLSVQEL